MAATFPSDAYCTALGRATITWGLLETGIDFLVAVSFNALGGHPKHPEIPRSLERKIGYLRAVARKDNMAEWSGEITHICDGTANLKETRHVAIHGVVGETIDDDTLKLWKITYAPQKHGTSDHNMSTATLIQLHEDVLALAIRAMNLTKAIMGKVESSINNPRG